MKTWEPGAKRDWQLLGLGVIGVFVAGLAAMAWDYRAEIARFLVSVAPWWFIPATFGVIGIGFFGWLIWHESRPAPPHIFCADDSRKPWEEVE